MRNISERLNDIEEKIADANFNKKNNLAGEVPFYVFDYEEDKEFMVRNHVKRLKEKFNDGKHGFKIVEINLFETLIKVLKEKGYLEKSLSLEKKSGSETLIEALKNTLRLKNEKNAFTDEVEKYLEKDNVIFITGVGQVYPFIRSHKLLNNLQPLVKQNPLILFLPGAYDGERLRFMSEDGGDNYYRAIRLVN